MTHTPGPWVVGGPYPKITVCQPAPFDDPWTPIAEVWPSQDHEASDEVKANAHLIAAAPTMLKVLAYDVIQLANLASTCDEKQTKEYMTSVYAAIAQAKGEEKEGLP